MPSDSEGISELDLEGIVASIDLAVDRHRQGIIGPNEAVDSMRSMASIFLRFADTNPDEVEFLVDYAREAIERTASNPAVRDPVLVDYFEEWVASQGVIQTIETQFDTMLVTLEARGMTGETEAFDELGELCRRGLRTHRFLMGSSNATVRVLRLAYRLGFADGLRDATSPRFQSEGQIADFENSRSEFLLALDLLAHLGADPDHGEAARSALLDLVEFVEIAGEAVVRLPLHLLNEADRQRLVDTHDSRTELLSQGPTFMPHSLSLMRDSRIVRGALWQAFDARHLR